MANVIYMKRQAVGDIADVVQALRLSDHLSDAELSLVQVIPDQHASVMAPGNVAALMCFEKYYIRITGFAFITVMIYQQGSEQMVTIVSFMSKESIFGMFSADLSLADLAVRALTEIGFTEIVRSQPNPFYGN